jgi:hypothetical protein
LRGYVVEASSGGEIWHTSEMAGIPGSGVRGRMEFVWLCALGMAVTVGPLIGQSGQPVAEGAAPTLHVYTNLIQVPVLVLAPNRQRLPEPIAPSRFLVSIGSGPWFRATHVRPEGDDAISLAILLDVHGQSAQLMDEIGGAIPSLAPVSLHEKDHVSIYALDCSLVRGASDIPTSAEGLKHGVDLALGAWKERTQMKPVPKCEPTMGLREAIGKLVDGFGSLPGRRVILAVTDGKDPSSKSEWAEVTSNAQLTGTTVFGLMTYPAVMRVAPSGSGRNPYRVPVEDPFNALCDLSGGLVLTTFSDSLKIALGRYVTMLRERYIVEFPRPSNSTAGKHSLAVRVERADDLIRVSGITVPMPDAKVLADPTTILAGPSNTPVEGERRVIEKH